jgi:DnaK suppressor protein
MKKEDLKKYQDALLAKQKELEGLLSNPDRRTAFAVARVPDVLDDVSVISDRAVEIQWTAATARLLNQVTLALARIDDGTFGVCCGCEDDIAPKRLAAVPWAAQCIVCQEADERGVSSSAMHGDLSLATA